VTVHDLLVRLLGPGRPAPLTPWIASSLLTIGLFLAYELGYWVDHRLSHAIPFLWAFHRVHHTAEQLSPLTNFRVHPVDSIVYLNILALFIGLTHGALTYWLGSGLSQFSIANNNVILFVFMFLLIHLQHSHVWIPARGFWGRIIQSPAHHQLHHSTNSAHFNRNFGGCLAVWDWLFGTLLIPEKHRERLAFGVESEGENPHSVVGAVIVPTARALTGLAAPLVHTRRTASRGV
jgi:sterol desaturase/sphingolipid hydroxylase (fatty acid hydroxylase superfamily)